MMDEFNFKPGFRILRLIGYGLFILVLIDIADIWIPAQLMNPSWELQAIGSMVEKVPLLWISLALIFLGEYYGYRRSEKLLLKFLSWFALLAGVLYFLFVPLSIFNLVRVDRQNNQRVRTEISQRTPVIQQIKDQVNQVETGEDLSRALSYLNQAGVYPKIENGQKLQEVKAQLVNSIAQSENQLKSQAQATIDSQRLSVTKKSIKWVLGALISGFLLMGIWRNTRWVRQMSLEDV
jgi:membrane protein implicated in regulation of membrane protease activity